MARSRNRAAKDQDAKGEGDRKPKGTGKRRAGSQKPKFSVRDISHVNGDVQFAGGDIVTTEIHEEATDARNEEEFEAKELLELGSSITAYLKSQKALSASQPEPDTFFHLKELELNEGQYLLGRAAILEQLDRRFRSKRAVFISGRSGIGRTSLLKAGLMPWLLERGHLPVLVSISGEPPELSIKRSLYAGIDSTTRLKEWRLAKFLEQASKFVPRGGQLVLLLEGYEHAVEGLQDFVREWGLSSTNRKLRWLFSIDHGFTSRLAALRPEEILEVPPLERDTAAQAIRRLEQNGLAIEEAYLDEILNELGKHRGALSDTRIHPAELQVVLRALAEDTSSQSLAKVYETLEGVNGIFEKHLVSTVHANFVPDEREVIWQILSFLREEYGTPVSLARIRTRLTTFGFRADKLVELLGRLRGLHILGTEEESFELAHVNLMRGIRKWLEKQTLIENARAQSLEQLNNIRASALRGMLAGAVGLAVFRRIVAEPIPDLAANVWTTLLFAPAGGLTGLLLTFFVDVFIARYPGTRPWQRYLMSAATGLVTFALGLALYVYLEEHGGDTVSQLLQAMLVGGAWGAVTGAGIAWVISAARVQIWKVPVIALASAFAFYFLNLIFPVLNRATPVEILVGGFWFPLVIVAATVLWRPDDPLSSFERST